MYNIHRTLYLGSVFAICFLVMCITYIDYSLYYFLWSIVKKNAKSLFFLDTDNQNRTSIHDLKMLVSESGQKRKKVFNLIFFLETKKIRKKV